MAPHDRGDRVAGLTQETTWKPDAKVDETRKLPDWRQFHRLCCERGNLCFDQPVKDGRRYACLAFSPRKTDMGGWETVPLATGYGAEPIDAVIDAYRLCGVTVPEVEAMVARRFSGVSVVDDFEELLA